MTHQNRGERVLLVREQRLDRDELGLVALEDVDQITLEFDEPGRDLGRRTGPLHETDDARVDHDRWRRDLLRALDAAEASETQTGIDPEDSHAPAPCA